MTEMACDDMSVEDALRRILPNVATVYIQNDSIARLDSRNPSEYIVLRKAPIRDKMKYPENLMEENKLTPFTDAPDTAVITCCHVTDDGAPVLYVSHDEDDGMWQFLCGGEHSEDEARIVSLRYIYELDHLVGLVEKTCLGVFWGKGLPQRSGL